MVEVQPKKPCPDELTQLFDRAIADAFDRRLPVYLKRTARLLRLLKEFQSE